MPDSFSPKFHPASETRQDLLHCALKKRGLHVGRHQEADDQFISFSS